MGLLRNGSEEAAYPLKLRGGSAGPCIQRGVWTRGCDVIGPHHFTTAWTEKIPNAATTPFVLPMKDAPVPPSGTVPMLTLMGVG